MTKNVLELLSENVTDPIQKNKLLESSRRSWDSKSNGGFLSEFSQTLGEGIDIAKGLFGLPTSAEKEAQARMMNEQIRSYREQTELTRRELAAKRDETAAQKRRINEKQIRSLRRTTRAQGLLGASQSNEADISSKLGG